ncbi:FAD-dependent oxidoreductase [Coxiella endosymbiont of Ornithodoros amblus]|uniref:FAD-dependent oxidoreductase n=1 Tax=Coxiella endosymbiont of Ornithodoros amblus TaxID=1656166 RepID=UPI00244DB8A1|nr:FAD-dependent oxidoreductase [Coxiella endosymbiont of Ornithodoros amblus]MBW5802819.1 FAD-dependent oxidoreductase [Coxiella endosymbiont of Ornithodoros amblus]
MGSGLAGYLFAKELRKLDTTTPLEIITANEGVFYSKPLLSTALTNKKSADELAVCTVDEMASQLQAIIHTHSMVEAIDPISQTVTTSHKKIAYKKLILACGSYPIPPSLQGNAVSDVYSVNDLTAYGRFRRSINNKNRIAVIGAGLVGCEFTNDLVSGGYQVEVITKEPYPLAKFVPESIGRALQQALANKGVQWHLQQVVSTVNRHQKDYEISMTKGKTVAADGIFSAIGIRARCDLAESIKLDRKTGIIVDRYLKTSIENIYALGDCAEVAGEIRQYIAPLLQCARALANHFAGDKKLVHYPPMPIVVKTSACAIVTYPPPKTVKGEWQCNGDGNNQRALFYDHQEKLQGFSLSGKCVKERISLTQQLPSVFE